MENTLHTSRAQVSRLTGTTISPSQSKRQKFTVRSYLSSKIFAAFTSQERQRLQSDPPGDPSKQNQDNGGHD